MVRVFNIHLQSIKLSSTDKDFIEQGGGETTSRKVAGKFKRAFQQRAAQAKAVKLAIKKSPHPVIVAGDFNDSPVSYTYRTLAKGMQDAFLKKGFGIGATYADGIPLYRIDYLLFDRQFKIHDFDVIKKRFSDHYPIVAKFGW